MAAGLYWHTICTFKTPSHDHSISISVGVLLNLEEHCILYFRVKVIMIMGITGWWVNCRIHVVIVNLTSVSLYN